MDLTKWNAIYKAIEILENNSIRKMEGTDWVAYKMGNIIRIDIKEEKK